MSRRKRAARAGPERRRLSRAWFAALLASIFLVLSFVGALRHEPWRDEYQAWMVARDASSVAQVFQNVKYEGNPALWHLVLFAVTRFSTDPLAMAFVHIALSTLMIWVFARHAALPPLPKVLFTFGYGPFFEYNLISRGYALGLLFLMTYVALYGQRDRRFVLSAVLLALMANTNPFGLFLSILLGVHWVFEPLVRRRHDVAWRPLATAAVILLMGWAASVAQIYPEDDNTFPVRYAREGFESWRFGFAASRITAAYLAIPPLTDAQFWNRTVFDLLPGFVQLLIALGLFAVFAFGFLRKPLLAVLYVGGTVLLVAFVYQTRMAYQRYNLHLFVLLVTCFAVERHFAADLAAPRLRALSERVRPWAGRLFLVVLIGSVVGGVGAYVADLMKPFSTSQEAAAFLRARGLDGLEIVGHTDFIVSPLAAILDKKIYYPERQHYGRFVVWDRGRKIEASFDDVADALQAMLERQPTFLWIADSQPTFHEDGETKWYEGGDDLVPGAHITLLATIPPGIARDEHYVIYRVDRIEGTSGR